MKSPVGKLFLAGDEDRLTQLKFAGRDRTVVLEKEWKEDSGPFRNVIGQLESYFAGKLKKFDVNVEPKGTPFQQAAWKALLTIPYGSTISYGEQARRMGKPRASRAVGTANGRNPISIIIPCHRVIGHNGRLTGYGGGLEVKQYLLDLERGKSSCQSLFS